MSHTNATNRVNKAPRNARNTTRADGTANFKRSRNPITGEGGDSQTGRNAAGKARAGRKRATHQPGQERLQPALTRSEKNSSKANNVDKNSRNQRAGVGFRTGNIKYPKPAGVRKPFNENAIDYLRGLDQVATVIVTENNKDLKRPEDTLYKDNFGKQGFPKHTSPSKRREHPVKITAPGKTPKGNRRFPKERISKKINF